MSWRVPVEGAGWRYFTLTLKIVSGTRSYAHANGLLELTYTSTWSHYFDSQELIFINRIDDTGVLTGKPRGR